MEETLGKFQDKIKEFWTETEKKDKIKYGIVVIISILALTLIILKLTSTKYEVLYGDLSLKDTGEITTKLDEMAVQWKLGENGNTILVPSDQKNKVKIELATYGLPKEGYSYMDAFKDTSWTMTDYDKKQRMKQALQSELSSTIVEMDGIKSAKVYVDEKEKTNFVLNDDDSKTTASVFLVKEDGKTVGPEKVKAIKHLVAGALNMDVENVVITDEEGRLLEEEVEDTFGNIDQFAIKENLEKKINKSIRNFLSNVYGENNVDVISSVKINMDSEKTTVVEFATPKEDSEEGLIRSLEKVEEHMVGGVNGGIPGETTNPPEDYDLLDDTRDRYDKVSTIINNELDEINREIRKAPGQVESVTVAVLINQDSLPDGEMTEEKRKEITDLVFAATGLDTKQVQVISERFNRDGNTNISTETGEGMNWLIIGGVLFALIIGALVAFVLIKKRNEKIKEDEEEIELMLMEETRRNLEDSIEDIDFEVEEPKMKAQINKFVDKKPDAVAQLLRNWLNE